MKLEVRGISKSFEKHKVLDDLNFSLKAGEITSLIGRNGSGKTTCMRIISGILKEDGGEVLIDGKSLKKKPELRENLAFLPDNFNYFKGEKLDQIATYYQLFYPDFDMDFFYENLEDVKLDKDGDFKSLSKGNKSIAGLIFLISTGARFLLLDELLDGIDILNKKKILKILLDQAEMDKGILISSHQIGDLEGISDDALYLDLNGNLKDKEKYETSFNKYQIVTKEPLNERQRGRFLIINDLGRVYVILSKDDIKEIERNNGDIDIVQYDQLEIRYEDLFTVEDRSELL